MSIIPRLCAGVLALTLSSGYAVALGKSVAPPPLPRPFGRGQAYVHRTEFAPYTFESTLLRIHFDFQRGTVYGDEVTIVRPKHAGLRDLPFNTLQIHYETVTVNGRPAAYTLDAREERINVHLRLPAPAGARLVVEFKYWAQPQRGIYFIRPDRNYPQVTPEIWSQGETTDNRRWFPTWDEPNQKTPSELIVTVPHGWTVVANGYLKSRARVRATDTWDWNELRPISTYLIAFAAGPLSKHHTTLGQARDGNVAQYGNHSTDVDSYVQPPYASLNAVCFGRTNDMVAYFQQIIGVKWPFEKYDQTTAERFIYGGMENASATIQTALALHPAIENPEQSCDVLVSHELAQQWWGDDVTMSDWSNEWINEGFATYYHQLWAQKDLGEREFEYDRYQAQQEYFEETRQYYRPIVDYVYADPLDLFDASGHERAAAVLHMLRHSFGDKRFFKALHDYLTAYQYKNASTHQFFTAIDKSLGTDLTWFENEWFYRDCFPHYYVTDRYDQATQTLTLNIRQKNHDGKPFRMPIEIEAVVNGRIHSVQPTIERNEQVVTMTGLGSKPQMVLFDPDNNILRELTFSKSVSELAYQLANAPHVGDREWALNQLGTFVTSAGAMQRSAAVRAVREAALADSFYGVRADAVGIAASFADATTLRAALRDRDKRVRIAAEQAAAGLEIQAGPIIRDLYAMSNDPDPDVAAAAFASLGALKAPDVYGKLVAGLNRGSFRQTVASGALRGLAAYGDVRALPLIEARTAYGTQEQERNAAVVALAQLAAHLDKRRAALPLLLDMVSRDPLITSRVAATTALGVLGDAAAIPVLERVERTDSQLIVQIAAWNAIVSIEDRKAV